LHFVSLDYKNIIFFYLNIRYLLVTNPRYASVTPSIGWKLPSSEATAIRNGRTSIALAIIGILNIRHMRTSPITIINSKLVRSPVMLVTPASSICPIVLVELYSIYFSPFFLLVVCSSE